MVHTVQHIIEIPQLHFDQAIDVPVVQVVQLARWWSRRAGKLWCSTFAVLERGGDMPVVVNDRCLEVPQVQFLRLWRSL